MRNKDVKIGIMACSFLISTLAHAQNFTIQANKDTLLIGEPIELTLTITQDSAKQLVFWPSFSPEDSISGGFEVLDTLPKTQANNLENTHAQQLIITSFNPGKQTLLPLVAQTMDSVYVSNSLTFQVNLMPVDTTASIKDIKPIIPAEITAQDTWKEWLNWMKQNWYIIFLALLVLGGLVYFLFIKKKKTVYPDEKKEEKPQLPPHQEALQHLQELKDQKAWNNLPLKEYYSRITRVIKKYTSGRYEIEVEGKTTTQLINNTQLNELLSEQKDELTQLLQLSDLVKFAKQTPSEEEKINLLNQAIEFVNKTQKTETPPQE